MKRITLPKILRTKRLLLKPIDWDNFDAWMEFIESPEALTYIPFINPTTEDCNNWIARQQKRYEEQKGGLYGIFYENTLVGQCGLLLQNVENEELIEIGYHIIPRYWKLGFATEAAIAWRDYAFENKLDTQLISIIHKDNLNSQAVALRNRFTRSKSIDFLDLPCYIYRLTYEDWLHLKD